MQADLHSLLYFQNLDRWIAFGVLVAKIRRENARFLQLWPIAAIPMTRDGFSGVGDLLLVAFWMRPIPTCLQSWPAATTEPRSGIPNG